jgi:hypothetical protein
MAKKASASSNRTTVGMMSLCTSARSRVPGCIASTRDKRSLSRLLQIEGRASPWLRICSPSHRQRERHNSCPHRCADRWFRADFHTKLNEGEPVWRSDSFSPGMQSVCKNCVSRCHYGPTSGVPRSLASNAAGRWSCRSSATCRSTWFVVRRAVARSTTLNAVSAGDASVRDLRRAIPAQANPCALARGASSPRIAGAGRKPPGRRPKPIPALRRRR